MSPRQTRTAHAGEKSLDVPPRRPNSMNMPNKNQASVTIVIVNWNSNQQLRECISSISRTRTRDFIISEVVVVDNGSTDSSLSDIERQGVPIRLIKNATNRGFAAACNMGAARSKSDYLLFLNPDASLFEDSLIKPIEFMQNPDNANIGICGIRLVDGAGNSSTSAARFPTLRVMVGKIIGLSYLLPTIFPSHLLSSNDLKISGRVDQVIGAFFLIRRDVFSLCNGFDEQFFVYFEEVDLSLRAKRLGYFSYFLSDASSFHKGGGCSDSVKATRLFYSLRSRILYARKHYNRIEFFALLLLTAIELPLRVARSVARLSFLDINNTVSAYIQLVVYFFRRSRHD